VERHEHFRLSIHNIGIVAKRLRGFFGGRAPPCNDSELLANKARFENLENVLSDCNHTYTRTTIPCD